MRKDEFHELETRWKKTVLFRKRRRRPGIAVLVVLATGALAGAALLVGQAIGAGEPRGSWTLVQELTRPTPR